jgi:membrane fusion protein, multidrug efflux system
MQPPPSPEPNRPRPSPPPLAAAGLLAALLAACGGGTQGPPPRPPLPVTVAVASLESAPIDLSATGTVESRSTVEVRSRAGGEVVRVHFDEGDEVQRGQLLFTIDPRAFQAALAEAEADLERNRVLAENASREAQRYAELVAKDFVTREEHDRVQAQARALQAGLAADRAAVSDARLQLSYAAVRSPIAGRAGRVLVHAGNNVRANEQTLVVLHQMAPLDVRFPLPQQHLGEVRRRAALGALQVMAREPGGASHVGQLAFVDNAVDPTTGMIQLSATFENADRALWPGQLVEVSLRLGEEQAVVAPEAAVQSGQQGDFVFVVRADGTVESRPVKVVRSLGGRVVIGEGLQGGETVVTDGQLRLTPGAKVAVRNTIGGAGAEGAIAGAQQGAGT